MDCDVDEVDDPAGGERTVCAERPAPVLIDLDEPTPGAAAAAANEPSWGAARRLMAVRLPKALTGIAVAGLLTSALASVGVSAGAAAAAAPIPSPFAAPVAALSGAAEGPTGISWVDGYPIAVQTDVAVPGRDAAERATNFLRQFGELYGQHHDPFAVPAEPGGRIGIGDPALDRAAVLRDLARGQGQPVSNDRLALEAVDVASPPGFELVAFRQSYRGLPVVGGDLLVGVEGERVVLSVGRLASDLEVDVSPELDAHDAERAAATRRVLVPGPDGGTVISTVVDPVLPISDLVVLDPGLVGGEGPARLAWRVVVAGATPETVLVDADDATILRRISQQADAFDLELRDADMAFERGYCFGTTYPDGVAPAGEPAAHTVHVADEHTFDPAYDGHADATIAFAAIQSVDQLFRQRYARDSYDGLGGQHRLFVDARMKDEPNASWSGWCGSSQYSPGMVSLDLVAHEVAHGVIYGGVFGGPDYAYESGAINESHSDVMGAMADGNWTVGEDLPARGGPGTRIRYMPAPDVDRYSEFRHTAFDHGGVHSNSGIGNHAAYLLASGATHADTRIAPEPVGDAMAGWLRYTASQLLPATATYAVLRGLEERLAAGIDADTACSVRNAWGAVEVGYPDLDCDGIDDDLPDHDGVYAHADNCREVFNPEQTDRDGDDYGDICDDDRDGDGVRDPGRATPPDNCPNLVNPDQADADGNGIGTVCDPAEADEDHDGVPTAHDNCVEEFNPGQEDATGDGVGDACDPDPDGDGIPSGDDNAPFTPNADQGDRDGDGIGDAVDRCPDTYEANVVWTLGNAELGVQPKPIQPDSDGDGTPDACDGSVIVGGVPGGVLTLGGPPQSVDLDLPDGGFVVVDIDEGQAPIDEDHQVSVIVGGPTGRADDLRGWIVDGRGRVVSVGQGTADRLGFQFVPVGGQDHQLVLEGAPATHLDGTIEVSTTPFQLSWPVPPVVANQPPVVVFIGQSSSVWQEGAQYWTSGTLNATHDPDGTIASWTIDFGDGTPVIGNTGAPPAVIFHDHARPGTFVARLTVTDDDGASTSAEQTTVVDKGRTSIVPASVARGVLGLRLSATLHDGWHPPTNRAGRVLVFRTRTGRELCRATTAANGLATCPYLSGLVPALLGGGYTVSFAGDEYYKPSTASAPLL